MSSGSINGLGTPGILSDPDLHAELDHFLSADGLCELVAVACGPRFELGHFREGVLAGILAYRDLVKQRSGLNEENDSTLMGKAFGGKPLPALVVADLSTETGRNIQRGMALLSEGLLAFVRNPLTHDSDELAPEAAIRMITLVDMLVRQVETRSGLSLISRRSIPETPADP